jgi:hypothetical protein
MPSISEITEERLMTAYGRIDAVRSDLDRLAVQLEALLRERQQIAETLTAFYREPTGPQYRAVLDLARDLDPALDERGRV